MALHEMRSGSMGPGEAKKYPVLILGVPVDTFDMAQTIDCLDRFIQLSRISGRGNQIATVNADFITNALADPAQMQILQKASLAMPDGMPVVWGARMLGAEVSERVAGVDVVLGLAERAANKGYSMYLLGAAPEVASRAAQILIDRFPRLKIVGVQSPMVRKIAETDPEILKDIRAKRPDILLVAFGNPKQELWIDHFADLLQVPVMIGVGGTLDFISGWKKRAPQWMQRFGLEWFYRLAQEPGRLWRRYGRNMFIFGPHLAGQWLNMQLFRTEDVDQSSIELDFRTNLAVISVQKSLTAQNLSSFSKLFEDALGRTTTILVDLSQTDYIDSTAFGSMVRCAWQARQLGGDLVLVGTSPKINRALQVSRLNSFFVRYVDLNSAETALVNRGTLDYPSWQIHPFSGVETVTKA